MGQSVTMTGRRFLSLRETAEFAGISPSSVLRWEAVGSFPSRRRLGPARVAWKREDLEAWAEEREPVTPTADQGDAD